MENDDHYLRALLLFPVGCREIIESSTVVVIKVAMCCLCFPVYKAGRCVITVSFVMLLLAVVSSVVFW